MNTKKFFMKMLMAATSLALLLTACAPKNEIQSTDGQNLVKQGDIYMTCLKESDWECAYALMSPSAQQYLDQAIKLASGAVNLKSMFRTAGFAISK
jgi:hypothetical protein